MPLYQQFCCPWHNAFVNLGTAENVFGMFEGVGSFNKEELPWPNNIRKDVCSFNDQ